MDGGVGGEDGRSCVMSAGLISTTPDHHFTLALWEGDEDYDQFQDSLEGVFSLPLSLLSGCGGVFLLGLLSLSLLRFPFLAFSGSVCRGPIPQNFCDPHRRKRQTQAIQSERPLLFFFFFFVPATKESNLSWNVPIFP